jgi:TIR domain
MKPTDPTHEPAVRAFCSYVHRDNQSLAASIECIVEDLRAFHEAETGRTLEIFFDRTDIGWGQDLRGAISDSVENATFFVPMITARYFQSAACRDELLSFYGKCRTLGVTELILPIVLAGSSQIRDDSDDEVIRIVATVRYMDWSEIWQSGRGSAAWNIGITHLVRRLVELQGRVEGHLAQATLRPMSDNPEEHSSVVSGYPQSQTTDILDEDGRRVIRDINIVVNQLKELLTDLKGEFDKIEIADQYSMRSALDRVGVKYAARGHDLVQGARSVLEELVEYDAQIRTIIRAYRQLANQDYGVLVSTQVSRLRDSALSLGASIRAVDAASDVLRKYGDISVSLRVALTPTRAGLQTIRDIANILDGWVSIEI